MERLHEKPDCDDCKALMEIRKEKGQDHISCDQCVPQLLSANREAAEIYFLVQGQVIIGGMGGDIIDLNYSAVLDIMALYGIENRLECFRKVRAAFNHMQEIRRERRGQ